MNKEIMRSKRLDVMYLSDNNYAIYAGVSILSLFMNNTCLEQLNVYVIDDGISEENKSLYLKMANEYGRNIFFLDMTRGVETLIKMGIPTYRNSYTTYLKLFAFQELPDDVEQIVFIDSDTVVVDSLDELCNYELNGNAAASVICPLSSEIKKYYNCPKNEPWFNMGMVLIDVNFWKKNSCEKLVIEQLKKRIRYFAVDQDILNIILHNKIARLHPRYNSYVHYHIWTPTEFGKEFPDTFMYPDDLIIEGDRRPAIRHFERFCGEGAWHVGTSHPYAPMYRYYFERSLWRDYEMSRASLNFTCKIEKMLFNILPKNVFLKLYGYFFNYNVHKAFKAMEIMNDMNDIAF